MTRADEVFAHAIEDWLETAPGAEDPAMLIDRIVDDVQATTQRRWSLSAPGLIGFAAAAAIAAVAVAAMLGYVYLVGPNMGGPAVSAEAPPTASVRAVEPSASMLPALGMPNYGQLRNTDPKDYGFGGAPGHSSGMHNVDLGTDIVFAVEADQDGCFDRGEGPAPEPTTLAGFAAVVVEPYAGDAVAEFQADGDETTRAYALDVAGRTLCIYLSWKPTTSPDELEAARAVLDTIRAQPFGDEGVRIVFTTLGWDNG